MKSAQSIAQEEINRFAPTFRKQIHARWLINEEGETLVGSGLALYTGFLIVSMQKLRKPKFKATTIKANIRRSGTTKWINVAIG